MDRATAPAAQRSCLCEPTATLLPASGPGATGALARAGHRACAAAIQGRPGVLLGWGQVSDCRMETGDPGVLLVLTGSPHAGR